MQLASGMPFYPLDPRPDEIDINDIAHALSNICRFGGHCKSFYSVAAHSLLVSTLVPQELKLTALLHDATEAYIGDMISPLKHVVPDFKSIERSVWLAIAARFGLPSYLPSAIHDADIMALAIERRDVVGPSDVVSWGRLPEPDKNRLAMSDADDKWRFLLAFKEYGGW